MLRRALPRRIRLPLCCRSALWRLLGAHIAPAHARDVRLGAEGRTPSSWADTGRLDYRALLVQLERLGREAAVRIERVEEDEVAETVRHVRQFLQEDRKCASG